VLLMPEENKQTLALINVFAHSRSLLYEVAKNQTRLYCRVKIKNYDYGGTYC